MKREHTKHTALQSIKKGQESFSCEICGKTCQNRHVLELHKSRHGASPVHKECEVCLKVIKCQNFSAHMLRHNMHGTFFKQCIWCEEKFSTKYIERHAMKKHFYGKFLCQKCPFSGSFAKDLIDHVNNEHECQSAKCPSCKMDHILDQLESHYKSCIMKKVNDGYERICPTCGKTLKGLQSFQAHKKVHLRQQDASQRDSSQKVKLYHYCDKCDKKFSVHSTLAHHIKSEHENFEYKCKACPMIFRTQWKLKHHRFEAHSTDERYQCKFCGIRKGTIGHIRKHELSHEVPKFQCRFCEKKLKDEEALQVHERFHTGDKQFKCPICENAFVSRKALLQHKRGVHKIAGPRGGKLGWSHKSKVS